MMGPQKVPEIRQKLNEAFSSTGKDPIDRLESLINEYPKQSGAGELLESLKRFMERPAKAKKQKAKKPAKGTRVKAKNRRAHPAA